MLKSGTHKDYDLPPDVPMFDGGKKRNEKQSEVVEALSSIAEGITSAISSPTPSGIASTNTGRHKRTIWRYICLSLK